MIIHKRGVKIERGHGIFDFIKPIFSVVKSIASNPTTPGILKSSVEIGKNTKNIIDAIRKKLSAPHVQDIINEVSNVQDVIERIKKLRSGSGCNCTHRSGKGFSYI